MKSTSVRVSVQRLLDLSTVASAAFVCLVGMTPVAATAQAPYSVQTKWTIGGEGGWDYLAVDAPSHRLYITHGTQVEVLDTATGKSAGTITGFKRLHGVVFDSTGKFGFVSDGGAGEVVAFDRGTLEKVASIPAGKNPDGLLFEPATKTVWAFNGGSSDATVIDASKRTVLATIALPGKPEFPEADGSGNVFVNIEDKNEIVRLDAKTLKATATWPLPGCESPSGLAIDTAGHRLFSVCDGKVMAVTDATTGKHLATVAIGEGPDAAGYDPAHKVAFSSNGDGTLTVVDAGKSSYPVLQTVNTERGARTMSFDSSNGKVYLITASFGPKPAPTAENPRPRPAIVPGSFHVIVVGR